MIDVSERVLLLPQAIYGIGDKRSGLSEEELEKLSRALFVFDEPYDRVLEYIEQDKGTVSIPPAIVPTLRRAYATGRVLCFPPITYALPSRAVNRFLQRRGFTPLTFKSEWKTMSGLAASALHGVHEVPMNWRILASMNSML